ncbi:MAG: glucosaminidase domain-containing protein [Thermoleophilia bacterium]
MLGIGLQPVSCGLGKALQRLLTACAAIAVFLAIETAPAMAVSGNEPISGYAPVTAAQMEAGLSLRNPGHIHPGIAEYYATWGPRFDIRSDMAFAQMMHETGSLRYGGVVQPWQNNFAGIGAFDAQHPGYSWPSAERGVIGHYAHLSWFIYPNHINSWCGSYWDPGHGSSHRNSARTLNDLNGQWAVPGVGYGDKLARYASEVYYFTPGGHWRGNFNEAPGTPMALLDTTFHFPWYDSRPENGMGGNWLIIGNQGVGAATVEIWIGGQRMNDPANPANPFFTIPEGGRITPSFSGVMGGPVKVVSLTGQLLNAGQRVIYRETFSEVPGTPASGLSDSLEFTWYDSTRAGYMFGNWIMIANMGSLAADVEVWVGDSRLADYKATSGTALQPGTIVTPMFTETMGGPVRVISTNHQPLIASQRVLYQESFNEVMGYPTADLASRYFLSWYDSEHTNGMKGDWLVIANRGSLDADVEVYVDGALKASYTAAGGNAVASGGIVAPSFVSLTDGPVEIVSTNGQPLLVSQRVLFRDSFEEVQGVPEAGLATDQYFPWYDSTAGSSMGGDWIMVTNPGPGIAQVEIWIGDVLVHDPAHPGTPYFDIPDGGSITPSFANTMGGPVRVVSLTGQPLLASQRVLYKYNVIYCGGVPCG